MKDSHKRIMKYLPALLSCTAITLLATINVALETSKSNSFRRDLRELVRESTPIDSSSLEEKIDEGALERLTRENNEYVITQSKKNSDLKGLVMDPERMRDYIVSKLGAVSHTYRQGGILTEDPSNIDLLMTTRLLRVSLILNSLEREEFRKYVGSLLEADLQDPFTEHGGYVLFDDEGRARLNPIESIHSSERDEGNNQSYGIGLSDLLKNLPVSILGYHLHAEKEDNSEYAGPSATDLGSAMKKAILLSESHGLVITKLAGREFNLDYYGWNHIEEGGRRKKRASVILDLGNYSY